MKASENGYQLPPFPAFPCISRYVPLGSVAEAIDRICRSIKSSDGISLLVGPPGTGKSLICRILADQFASSHNVVVLGDTSIEDKSAFYRHLLHHLGVDLGTIPQGDLHLALIDAVYDKNSAAGGLLIIVDEAQALSPDVLEAIRMATNIMRNDQPRVTAVVCGGAKLDDTLTAPALEPFTQRVSTRCYLHPMNAGETKEYIRSAIRACDSNPDDIISEEAIGAVHHACSGVPRLINQIMTEAIDCAAENDQDHICEKVIDLAWAQLQQLPSPMVEEPKIKLDASPVEFGTLSDSAADQVAAMQTDPIKSAPIPAMEAAVAEPQDCQATEEACQPADQPVVANVSEEQTQVIEAVQQETVADRTLDVTVQWADEPEDQETLAIVPGSFRDIPAPKPLPAELFGEFEIEESIPVGNGVVTTPTTNETPLDLESMIHSEIVSLSEIATEARFGCGGTDVTEMQSASNHHQPVVWFDACEDQPTEQQQPVEDDIVLSTNNKSDDSDLLIIEDEVEIAPQPSLTRVDNQEQTINVDFRSMLSNMRHSS
jgi:type II secretory pathway predicted ATPase ExeA